MAVVRSPTIKGKSVGADRAARGGESVPDGVAGALRPLDLTIEGGELLVVLGPSGSGKSTLLRLIAGLEPPSSGSVWIDGSDMSGCRRTGATWPWCFRHPALYPHLSVFDNLAFGLRARGVSEPKRGAGEQRRRACSGSTSFWPGVPASFPEASGSGWRSAGRWRAQPRIVLFDEPFSNLDVPLRVALREQVVELHRRFGTTLIHVTHDQAEALLMGDRVVHPRPRPAASVRQPACGVRSAGAPVRRHVRRQPADEHPAMPDRGAKASRSGSIPSAPTGTLPWTADAGLLPRDWRGTTRLFDLGMRPEAIAVRRSRRLGRALAILAEPNGARPPAGVQRAGAAGDARVGPHRLVARLPATQDIHERQRVDRGAGPQPRGLVRPVDGRCPAQ